LRVGRAAAGRLERDDLEPRVLFENHRRRDRAAAVDEGGRHLVALPVLAEKLVQSFARCKRDSVQRMLTVVLFEASLLAKEALKGV